MNCFFSQGRKYAVLGASTSPFKFGNKILKWYINHSLEVVPINPKEEKVCNIKAVKTLNEYITNSNNNGCKDLELSVSVVTSPTVSYKLFEEVKNAGNQDKVHAIWFQPGSYDTKVVDYVKKEFGVSEEKLTLIADGDCILVSGALKLKCS